MGAAAEDESLKEKMSPRWIAVLATWLASPESKGVTGRVFDVQGNMLAIAEGGTAGPQATQPDDPTQLKSIVADLMSRAELNTDMSGRPRRGPGPPVATRSERPDRQTPREHRGALVAEGEERLPRVLRVLLTACAIASASSASRVAHVERLRSACAWSC